MVAAPAPPTPAYDALARVYDLIAADHAHESWLRSIEVLAREHGLHGRRVLDVACGTGRSFIPLLDLGYEVTACDVSPRMAELAAEKAGERARVLVADMRDLPHIGRFDLVTCLLDAVNHLLTSDDVLAAFAGVRDNLASDGLFVFDVNTTMAYATAQDVVAEGPDGFVVWRGSRAALAAPGGTAEILVEIFTEDGDGLWRRESSSHEHRHYPLGQVAGLLDAVGLEPVCVRGQLPGAILEGDPDEARHPKALFVARRR